MSFSGRYVQDDFEDNIPNAILTRKNMFQNKTKQSDLILVIEVEDVHVCRAVLSVASPVFSAMFDSEFQEKSMGTIELPDKTYNHFVEFLECIYPNVLNPVTGENVYTVVPLADEYQVEALKRRCHDVLIELTDKETNRTGKTLYRHLQIAERYGLDRLEEECIYLSSELKSSDMNGSEWGYTVSVENELRIKETALVRYELEKEDEQYFIEFDDLNSLKSTIEGNLRSPQYIYTCDQRRIKTNTSNTAVLLVIRLTYRFFETDTDFKDKVLKMFRRYLKKFTTEDQEIFALLPAKIKNEVRE